YQLVLPPLVADKCTVSQQKCDFTNILQRLTSRRKEKHKDRLRQWHEKLSEISQDIENQVKECCETTADLLNTSWERQNQILNANQSDEAFTKIPHYEEHIVVQNLPFSVDPILLESDYQLVLPPLVADKCTVSQQKCDFTNILQRLTSRRKEKHKDRLRKWHEKLSEISQDIESQVKECCETTADLLNTSWERQNQILNANQSDEIIH
ncbi:uncharacterized protein DC041_0004258, partial [Schistosoma bovis]